MGASENPPAFPEVPADSNRYEGRCGMTLRDWFAGQVASAYAKYGPQGHAPADMVARAAYELADAMLAARDPGATLEPEQATCPQCGGLESPLHDCVPF